MISVIGLTLVGEGWFRVALSEGLGLLCRILLPFEPPKPGLEVQSEHFLDLTFGQSDVGTTWAISRHIHHLPNTNIRMIHREATRDQIIAFARASGCQIYVVIPSVCIGPDGNEFSMEPHILFSLGVWKLADKVGVALCDPLSGTVTY